MKYPLIPHKTGKVKKGAVTFLTCQPKTNQIITHSTSLNTNQTPLIDHKKKQRKVYIHQQNRTRKIGPENQDS